MGDDPQGDESESAAELYAELQRTRQILDDLQRVAQVGHWTLDLSTWRFTWSDGGFRIWGRDPDLASPTYPEYVETLPSEDRDLLRMAGERAVETGEPFEIEHRVIRPDGAIRWVRLQGRVLDDGSQMVGAVQDITERRELEAQFQQSQKMEAVGRLAGGIAHDFNNLLTAIFSFTEFAMETLDDEAARDDLREVLQAAERARDLTGQLLAFSRRKPVRPVVMDVNEAVGRIDRLLRRLLGEDIEYALDLSADSANIEMDPGALEQVLVNIAVNARDAMPSGGHLYVSTEVRQIDAHWNPTTAQPIEPGEYVAISIEDDGDGIEPDTLSRLFEPFFTTKQQGAGTGLGLSTCLGIVQQAGGHITVESEPGVGSTFTVLLPRRSSPKSSPSVAALSKRLRGTERILVVEDDAQVRELTLRILQRYGYDAIGAAAPDAAIAALTADDGADIDLLLTDVVMPQMSGPELAGLIARTRPGLRVLFMSGYTGETILSRGTPANGGRLLQKPFTPERLVAAVRATLDGDPTSLS